MSEFKDIKIIDVGIPLLEGYRFYPLAFKLSRQPDKKWINCLKNSYIQSYAQVLDQELHSSTSKEDAVFIFQTFFGTVAPVPDDEKEILNGILGEKEDKIDLFSETASIIAPYLNNRGELVFPWVEGFGSKDGWEAMQKFLPYAEQWIKAANDCRHKNE